MSNGADFDDSNLAIVYSGDWQALTGTISQQFDNTIHQSSVTGASATIKFTGTRITVYQTVPEGVGTESVTINFDGSTSSMARDTHPGTSYYQDRWFDSGPLTDGVHLLTLTNAGVNGGTPFMLDRVNVEGTLIAPPRPAAQAAPTTTTTTKAPVPTSRSTTTSSTTNTPSTTSASTSQHLESTSTTSTLTSASESSSTNSSTSSQTSSATPVSIQTVVSVQYITNSANGAVTAVSNVSPSSFANDPVHTTHGLSVGAIVGVALASVLAILLLLLLLFCLVRRRRKAAGHMVRDHEAKIVKPRNQTDVSPFHISQRESFASPVEGLDIRDMSVVLARKASDTSTTSRQESFITSNAPPSSNRAHPEKNSEFLSDASDPNTFTFATLAPSNNAVNRNPETDAGPYRPSYLSGDTMYMSSSGIYASTAHLNPVDTNDVPPSYQSASHRNSGA